MFRQFYTPSLYTSLSPGVHFLGSPSLQSYYPSPSPSYNSYYNYSPWTSYPASPYNQQYQPYNYYNPSSAALTDPSASLDTAATDPGIMPSPNSMQTTPDNQFKNKIRLFLQGAKAGLLPSFYVSLIAMMNRPATLANADFSTRTQRVILWTLGGAIIGGLGKIAWLQRNQALIKMRQIGFNVPVTDQAAAQPQGFSMQA